MSAITFTFVPTTKLSGGHFGLKRKQGSTSDGILVGSGLSDGLPVIILEPQKPSVKRHEWTGTTANTDPGGAECTVKLTEENAIKSKISARDDSTTVSITVGDGTNAVTQIANVYIAES
jgi:hypothetical protein